jgi:toxin ParE1/3/4
MKVLISSKAHDDLIRIYLYLVERNPSAAETVIGAIDTKFGQLSLFPFIGRKRSSLALGLRSTIVGMHLIFYTVERERITIVRVIDGRMDIDEEFQR